MMTRAGGQIAGRQPRPVGLLNSVVRSGKRMRVREGMSLIPISGFNPVFDSAPGPDEHIHAHVLAGIAIMRPDRSLATIGTLPKVGFRIRS